MKERCYISFNISRQEGERFSNLIKNVGCSEGWHEPSDASGLPYFDHTFCTSDPRYARLRDLLSFENVECFERRDHLYSSAELRAAPLMEFQLDTAPRNLGKHYDGLFDFSHGCPHCGTGGHQIAPLRLRPSAFPKKALICQSLDDEFLVNKSLHLALAEANLSGLRFLQAVSTKGQPLDWWQLIPEHEMPPMEPESLGIIRDPMPASCDECQRDSWFHSGNRPSEFTYCRAKLGRLPLPDVTQTYECFGVSAFDVNGYVAHGRMLVSPAFFDVMDKLKVRGARFYPVKIIDE